MKWDASFHLWAILVSVVGDAKQFTMIFFFFFINFLETEKSNKNKKWSRRNILPHDTFSFSTFETIKVVRGAGLKEWFALDSKNYLLTKLSFFLTFWKENSTVICYLVFQQRIRCFPKNNVISLLNHMFCFSSKHRSHLSRKDKCFTQVVQRYVTFVPFGLGNTLTFT